MTRLNLIPPSELMDQHLFAEFREIKMVPKALQRSLNSRREQEPDLLLWDIPSEFTLGKGHVKFFYNKGLYLRVRYLELKDELSLRGYAYNEEALLDPDQVFGGLGLLFNQDYTPTESALTLVRERISERISQRPGWYRYKGILQR